MTDESQQSSPEETSEQSEGLVGKLVHAAKNVQENVSDFVGDAVEKVEELVGDVAHRVGLGQNDQADAVPSASATDAEPTTSEADVVTNANEVVADTDEVVTAMEQQPASADVAAEPVMADAAVVESSASTPVSFSASSEPVATDTDTADTAAPMDSEPVVADTDMADTAAPMASEPVAAEADTEETSVSESATAQTDAADAAIAADQVADVDADVVSESDVTNTHTADEAAPMDSEPAVAEADAADEAAPMDSEPAVAEADADSADSSPTEGAVFEPVDDDQGDTPRRLADLEPGMELEGRVTSTALYGVFVDVGVGRDGLVHISEMSDQRIESPTDLVQIGDMVNVRVKSVDPDKRRISLSMRSPQPEGGRRRNRGPRRPEVDMGKLSELSSGDLVEGTVNGIAPFGVFVDIGVGKDGLVHISELSEGRVEQAEDAVTIGETYTFRVLEVDAEGQRISLSLRRAQEDFQERQRGPRRREINLEGIEPGAILSGTVNGIAPFGAFIDLGVGRDGLVHISELSEGRVGKVEDVVNVGDQIQVRVLEVDPGSKRISLSMRLEPPAAPISTTPSGSSRLDRDWSNPAVRDDRQSRPGEGDRRNRRDRGGRRDTKPAREAEPEVYTFGAEEEVYEGNATLDDLLSKYGAEPQRRSSKRRLTREDYDEERETRESQARREAIRRTLDESFE